MKPCTVCGIVKHLSEFNKHGTAKDGLSWQCRACSSAANRRLYARNGAQIRAKEAIRRQRPGAREKVKDTNLRWQYGISLDEFRRMNSEQGGVCAICGSGPRGKSKVNLVVDHDHKTGEIRALLCSLCNQGLGHFSDNPERMIAASEYIKKHQTYGHARVKAGLASL